MKIDPNAAKIGDAVASPTKDFFVSMLTRDIELQDALLDLLDNCVDGILRSNKVPADPDLPYKGFHAKLLLSPDCFSIEDNCGGIPIETAQKYAFAMGRPKGAVNPENAHTVGMYGIGMKRAIFKLGTDALVESRNDTGFTVEFSPEWMTTDTWDDLPMYDLSEKILPNKGTKVVVYDLHKDVAASFASAGWIDEFRKTIARNYSLIMAKGFEVSVAESEEGPAEPIRGEPFQLLQTAFQPGTESRIFPFIYVGEIDGVKVEVYAGLYRELLTAEEADAEDETRGRSDDAGWTVACNDRVVIWKDKTRLTGWGEGTVPNYHGQFIAITGIVLLSSAELTKLPLTTTKRGVDASADIYSKVKDLMNFATKRLTTFTNKWRKFPDNLEDLYLTSSYIGLRDIQQFALTTPLSKNRKYATIRNLEPSYPVPKQDKTSVRVSFTAEKTEVRSLALFYFADEKVKAGDVGEKAFLDAVAEHLSTAQ